MPHPRKYTDQQRLRAAYAGASRERLKTDKELAAEIGCKEVDFRNLMRRVRDPNAGIAYREGFHARMAGQLFADNPYLDVPGREIQMRFWVDGHVDAIVDERLQQQIKAPETVGST